MDSEKDVDPPLCVNGCGFFGTPSTRNLCSKCYTDFLKQELIAKSAEMTSSLVNDLIEPIPNLSPSLFNSDQSKATTTSNGNLRVKKKKKKKKKRRCESCNKKVGLLGFECRCGGIFCDLHRYAEKHSCPFDYKALGRDVLAKANLPCHSDHNLNNRI